MAERQDTGLVKLSNVRLSFEHLFKKTASVQGGALKYRANFLIDPNTRDGKRNIQLVEQAIEDVKEEAWPGKASKIVVKADRNSYKDGDDQVSQKTGEIYDGYEGMKVVSANNDRKPKLRARDGRTEVQEEDDLLHSGAYVNAWVRFYAVKSADKGGNGIFASLEGVQFVRHGDKFTAGGIDDDAFEDLGDEDDEEGARPAKRSRVDDEMAL